MGFFKELFGEHSHNDSSKQSITLEKGIINSRLQMIRMTGIASIQDIIHSYHYCTSCKRELSSITAMEDGITNDYKAFANKLRDYPSRIIGKESQCNCKGSRSPITTLTKVIFLSASPHQNIDLHLYIQYATSVSKFAVELIVVRMNGTITKFSENDRIGNIGF